MTAIAPEIDTTVLEDLDFDAACQADWNVHEPPCDKPAEWVVYFVKCCKDSPPLMACDGHKEDILTTSLPACCKTCGRIVCSPFRKAILRIEPLNGGAS